MSVFGSCTFLKHRNSTNRRFALLPRSSRLVTARVFLCHPFDSYTCDASLRLTRRTTLLPSHKWATFLLPYLPITHTERNQVFFTSAPLRRSTRQEHGRCLPFTFVVLPPNLSVTPPENNYFISRSAAMDKVLTSRFNRIPPKHCAKLRFYNLP